MEISLFFVDQVGSSNFVETTTTAMINFAGKSGNQVTLLRLSTLIGDIMSFLLLLVILSTRCMWL